MVNYNLLYSPPRPQSQLADAQALVFLCTNGVRSRIAAKDVLRQPELQQKTIFHLKGGIVEDEG